MKKADVKEGAEYAASAGRDLFGSWWHTPKRVLVVSNDDWHRASSTVHWRTLFEEHEGFRVAEMRRALCEAFPDRTTPAEMREANDARKRAYYEATEAYFEADPMRRFRKGAMKYETSGVLVKVYLNDGKLSDLRIMPRRELKMPWVEYEQETARRAAARAEANRLAAEAKARRAMEHASLEARVEVLKTLLDGTGVTPELDKPYGLSSSTERIILTGEPDALERLAAGLSVGV